jgi:hypothetical protein
MRHRPFLFLALIAILFLVAEPASAQQSCESLASLKIPNVTITMATSIHAPPDFDVPSTPGRFGTPPGLKVSCRSAAWSATRHQPVIRISASKSGCRCLKIGTAITSASAIRGLSGTSASEAWPEKSRAVRPRPPYPCDEKRIIALEFRLSCAHTRCWWASAA